MKTGLRFGVTFAYVCPPFVSSLVIALSLALSPFFFSLYLVSLISLSFCGTSCGDSRCQMLMNLHREQWTQGLVMRRFEDHQTSNEKTVEVSWAATNEFAADATKRVSCPRQSEAEGV